MSPGLNNAEETCLKNHQRPGDEDRRSINIKHDDRQIESESGNSPGSCGHPIISPLSIEEEPGHDTQSAEAFPEGGLAAWLVVFGSFCAMGAIFGLINTSAAFESFFQANQLENYSHSSVGWIFSVYLFLVFFVGVQVGPIFDRFGSRAIVAVGSLLMVSSLMLLSISKTYTQIILTYSVLGGLGGALLNVPAYGAIAHFFSAKRGVATGLATTAGGLGGIVFPLLLQPLLSKHGVGFAWSCRILGFILLGLLIPANLLIKTRLSTHSASHGNLKAASIWPDMAAFKDRRFALAAGGAFFMEWGLFVPLTYIMSYAQAHGIRPSECSVLLALLNTGSVLGRFLPGLLADRLGRFNVIIITIALCAASVLGIWLPSGGSKPTLVAFCVIFGFVSGSNLGLMPVCLGQFCEPQNYGRYFSTAVMVASFGTLSSVPIGGALLSVGNGSVGWTALILFSGVAYAMALICYASARILTVGWTPRVKF